MTAKQETVVPATYYVDEAGDGVLFGHKGRVRIREDGARKFFILGMIRCVNDAHAADSLRSLRERLLLNPLYSGIPSMSPEAKKTAQCFHAKDDHNEIRAKVFEVLTTLDFRFFAVIKQMSEVLKYVRSRNLMDSSYRYKPNELYDLTTRMLFKQRLHKEPAYRITFARRGARDRTEALRSELAKARKRFEAEHSKDLNETHVEICPAYPREAPCLQITDYALWALQRCYEMGEDRFLRAIWSKVSLIHDVDDPLGKRYGTFFTRKSAPPDVGKIKNRWI
ncbi:MAG: DUF3800 domain-containing protein [Opitutales bacterium]|nr:DUF3800 domain-containing protein [Opitutales bacterium]